MVRIGRPRLGTRGLTLIVLTTATVAAAPPDNGEGDASEASDADGQDEGADAEDTADEEPTAPAEGSTKAWAKGVSSDQQAAALASFKKGNDYFGERQYGEALRHYKDALSHWKHPAIHFNTAVCQVNLDQPIEAYQNIKAALKYKNAPLGGELYAQGLTYEKLLTDRLGYLTVKARDKGARVTLDGEDLLIAPGEKAQVILPGKHQIVAELDGYLTYTRSVQVDPGGPTRLDIKMVPLDEATTFERPMATWLPWTVMGGGAVIGATGVLMRTTATARIQRYDDYIDAECQLGCTDEQIPDEQKKSLTSGKTWDVASIATMSVGGAAFITGVTLLILNSPRPMQPKDEAVAFRPKFTPVVSTSGAYLDMNFAF